MRTRTVRAALAATFFMLLACAGQEPATDSGSPVVARGGGKTVRARPPGFKFPRGTPPAPKVDSTATFTVHIAPTGSCDPAVIQGMSCGDVCVVGDNTVEQDVFICMSGVESLRGSSFAIEYPPTVDVLGWDFCASVPPPASIPGPSWPASGSYIALAWSDCQELEGDLRVLVRLRVAAGSTGMLSVVSFLDQDLVPCVPRVDDRLEARKRIPIGELVMRPSCGFGSVSVGGRLEGEPRNACGACR